MARLPATATGETGSGRVKHKVRKRRTSAASKTAESDGPSWEHARSRTARSSHHERRTMRWMLGGGVALFVLIVGGSVIALLGGKKTPPVSTQIHDPPPPTPPPANAGLEALPPIMKRTEASLLAEAEPLARKFLEATTPEEMLPLVRNPARAKPRMHQQYPDGRIVPPGLDGFNTTRNVVFRDSAALIAIRTLKFETRQLALLETPEGLKIDWESWVGWSDMSWPALLASLPATAQVFRVIVKRVDYYNFGFADDKKWKSYRLESLDGEHMIFGYVEIGSPAMAKIRLSSEQDQSAMTLKIRFPAASAAGANQVLIDEVVTDGWIEKID